jgi:predicted nuclease with TOPRIM domain
MIKLCNKGETLQRVYEDTLKVNELRETYCEQLDRSEKLLEHAKDYNRLLNDYKTLKAHYKELNKECKELQEENISLLINQKSSERTKSMILDEVQQLHDRVMELIAEEMNEDD